MSDDQKAAEDATAAAELEPIPPDQWAYTKAGEPTDWPVGRCHVCGRTIDGVRDHARCGASLVAVAEAQGVELPPDLKGAGSSTRGNGEAPPVRTRPPLTKDEQRSYGERAGSIAASLHPDKIVRGGHIVSDDVAVFVLVFLVHVETTQWAVERVCFERPRMIRVERGGAIAPH